MNRTVTATALRTGVEEPVVARVEVHDAVLVAHQVSEVETTGRL